MNILAFSDVRRLSSPDLMKLAPIMVTVDGVECYVISKAEDVAVIGDLHPRVRNTIRNLIARARIGMPKDSKLYIAPPRDRSVPSVGIAPQEA
jgi:hypothetical protein